MKKLYYGGSIITMEDNRYTDALLTEDDAIIGTGSREDLMDFAEDAEEVNLDGAVLMPGFIDPHSHYSQVASGLLQVSLDGASSFEEMKKRINTFTEEKSGCGKVQEKSGWIRAKDYDHNLLPGGKHLSAEQINALSPDHPLIIQHKSGHMGLLNAAAMDQLGINDGTPSPEGGNIGHENGHLNGYIEENAYITYAKKVPMPAMSELEDAYIRAQDIYASYGITTMQEGMLVSQMLPLYRMLFAKQVLKLDLVAYPDMPALDEAYEEFSDSAGKYNKHIKLGGMKIFLDGSPQGRTAWMRTPYTGDAGEYGYGTMKDEDVRAAFDEAAKRKIQLLAHCNGDAAAAQMIRCLAEEEKKYPVLRELKPVMIHAQLLGKDQIPEAVSLGIIASFFAAHVYHWGDIHIKNFGMKRAAQISPAATAMKTGLPFTFHQDSPVIQPDMLETIWCAVNRKTKKGILLGEDERIPAYDALKAVTVNAAYQYSEEKVKGSLAAGKKADLVILDHDPLTAEPDDIRSIKVLETIKNGSTIYRS